MTFPAFYRPHGRIQLDTGDKLITKQAHKDECDINRILRQFQKTGIITHVQNARPTFQDLPSDIDFQMSLHLIQEAEQAFSELPSRVRDHFNNDPAQFLASFDDPNQADKLREFGLLSSKPAAPAPAADPASTPDS